MKYISLFSGIECASVAAKSPGWSPICFSEIELFPGAVLAHHYPDVPNVGDMTRHDWSQYRGQCDVVVGGSPCQAFSIAGRRGSLADDRGNLTLSFVEAVEQIDPAIVIWENVPGVLSTKDNAFGCFLGAIVGEPSPLVPFGKWTNAGLAVGPKRSVAWRVLDAQYFGVAQRRRRVFLVGCTRSSGIDPAEILFEFDSLRRYSPPSREAKKDIAADTGYGAAGDGEWGRDSVAGTVSSKWAKGTGGPSGDECQNLVAGTMRSVNHGDSHANGGGQVAVTVALRRRDGGSASEVGGEVANALQTGIGGNSQAYVMTHAVRRLTPLECERLQGLPDDYTLIPWRKGMATDGPRYKAIGNGMAVPCIGWVIRRVDDALKNAPPPKRGAQPIPEAV